MDSAVGFFTVKSSKSLLLIAAQPLPIPPQTAYPSSLSPFFPPALKDEAMGKDKTYKMQVTHVRPRNDGSC